MDSIYKYQQVAVNDFVKRQIEGSGKSYSNHFTFDQIAKHAEEQLHKGRFSKGYREGVLIVDSDSSYVKYFKCPFVKIDENTKLKAEWVRRRNDEEPYIQIRALNGSPLKAGKVEFVIYHHDVLDETSEQTTNADWELISIHALPEGIEKLPMGYITMMRNQLGLKGGTAAHYSSNEWGESVYFWQKYASLVTD